MHICTRVLAVVDSETRIHCILEIGIDQKRIQGAARRVIIKIARDDDVSVVPVQAIINLLHGVSLRLSSLSLWVTSLTGEVVW